MRQILLIMIGLSLGAYAGFSRANGVVTDSTTALQWQDDYSDNAGNIKQTTWADALNYCHALSLDGTGWRLPNKKELLSIVDYSTYNPSIDSTFTNTTSGNYWSSATHAGGTSYAWYVGFYYGYTSYYNKTSTSNVRCVR